MRRRKDNIKTDGGEIHLLRIGAGTCEHGSEPTGLMKDLEFLE